MGLRGNRTFGPAMPAFASGLPAPAGAGTLPDGAAVGWVAGVLPDPTAAFFGRAATLASGSAPGSGASPDSMSCACFAPGFGFGRATLVEMNPVRPAPDPGG